MKHGCRRILYICHLRWNQVLGISQTQPANEKQTDFAYLPLLVFADSGVDTFQIQVIYSEFQFSNESSQNFVWKYKINSFFVFKM